MCYPNWQFVNSVSNYLTKEHDPLIKKKQEGLYEN